MIGTVASECYIYNIDHLYRGKGDGHAFDYGWYQNTKTVLGYPAFWILPLQVGIIGDGTRWMSTNIPDERKKTKNFSYFSRDCNNK